MIAPGSDAAHLVVGFSRNVPKAGPDPFFVVQPVLLEKGSGPACGSHQGKQNNLWAASDPSDSGGGEQLPELCQA